MPQARQGMPCSQAHMISTVVVIRSGALSDKRATYVTLSTNKEVAEKLTLSPSNDDNDS